MPDSPATPSSAYIKWLLLLVVIPIARLLIKVVYPSLSHKLDQFRSVELLLLAMLFLFGLLLVISGFTVRSALGSTLLRMAAGAGILLLSRFLWRRRLLG